MIILNSVHYADIIGSSCNPHTETLLQPLAE